ncbi:MAG TPA: PHP domain-containing protein [Actinomycetota bacterium]|nr:PHP domain-containing protein [Actinomycetota bacterium]
MLTNAVLAELLARSSEREEGHRQRALRRAARAAFTWPEEAIVLVEEERSLTEFPGVGPWLAHTITLWLENPPEAIEPPEVRRGFLTLSEVRSVLEAHPDWRSALRADLQMHTTYSDGSVGVREMLDAASAHRYEYVAITDHSKGLKIARGMDESRLATQGREIDQVNEELQEAGPAIHGLRSIEMNLSPQGEGDMQPEALAALDLVLGAFHSQLRTVEDQTDRYLAALRNPTIHVLAHPQGRKFNLREGLRCDWPRVFAAAAELDVALEIDAYPDRQDLKVELLRKARDAGVRISLGTDAHHPDELRFMEFGLAAAIQAGITRDRILNYLSRDRLQTWARETSGRRGGR